MGKKRNKKEKKDTNRTSEERQEQVNIIKSKLLEYQLDDRVPDIETLYKIMDNYIETGQSISGTYPLQGSNKNIQYILSNKKHINCTINLLVRNKIASHTR